MKRLLVLGLLVATMAAVSVLQGSVDGDAVAPLTFAIIGFVILAAYALAEIAGSFGLPAVTGYILAGIVLGPQIAGLIDSAAVEEMKVFNTLALALIALEAGLELRIDSIKRVAKTLASIVAFKIPLAWICVGGAFLAVSPWAPLVSDMEWGPRIAIALMLGALSVGTSPAVSVAVISEANAKGRVADTVLAIAVFKDVVMIIMLAIAMAAATVLTTEGAAFEATTLVALAKKIVLSLAAGAVVGGALIAYMRWLRWELVLTLLILGYGVNAACDLLHLKPLLVFIAAGFTVTNFSRYGHDVHKPMALLALPVFIVFFTTVGAGLDLTAAVAVAPVALLLFGSRIGMLYGATRLGGWVAGDTTAFSNVVWRGFVSQAGVALGLLLVAQETVPAVADELGQFASVLIALNLLVGPVLLRGALSSGDALETGTETETDTDTSGGAEVFAAPEPPAEPELLARFEELDGQVRALTEQLDAEVITPWLNEGAARLHTESAACLDDAVPVEITALPLGSAIATVQGAARTLRDSLDALPLSVRGTMSDFHTLPRPDMPVLDASLQRIAALLPGRRTRRVPLRQAARTTIEGHIVPALAELVVGLARAEATRLERVAALAGRRPDTEDETSTPGDAAGERDQTRQDALQAAAIMEADELRRALRRAASKACTALAQALRLGGTSALPARRLHYRTVAADVDRAMNRLGVPGQEWDDSMVALAGRATVEATLDRFEAALTADVDQGVATWRARVAEELYGPVERVVADLDTAWTCLVECDEPGDREEVVGRLTHAIRGVERGLRTDVLPSLAASHGDGGTTAPLLTVEGRVTARVDELQESVGSAEVSAVGPLETPADISRVDVNLRQIARQHLAGDVHWLGDAREDAEVLIDRVTQRLGEISGITSYGLRLAGDGDAAALALPAARDSLQRARRVADRLKEELSAGDRSITDAMVAYTADAVASIRTAARTQGQLSATLAKHGDRLLRGSIGSTLVRGGGRLGRALVGLPGWYGRFQLRLVDSELARSARQRAGTERLDPRGMAAEVARLAVSAEQRSRMPYVLTRLFGGTTSDLAPVGHDKQLEGLQSAWERFTAGRPTAVLMTGSDGSGRTSVARSALEEAAGRRLVVVSLDPTARTEAGLCSAIGAATGAFEVEDFEELEEALGGRRRVVLLDDVEVAFTRTPEGLRHIRRLLQVIARTRHRVLWVVSVVSPTATLLERACGLSRWFTDHVHFAPMASGALGALLDSRLALTGLEAAWPEPNRSQLGAVTRLRWLLQVLPPLERRKLFYRELAAASGGNIGDALTLWLNAVESVEGDTVYLRPVTSPALAWFDQLGRDAHRVLALTMQCGLIGREEAIEALGWDGARVDEALSLTRGAGLLRQPAGDERFCVHPRAWRRAAELLEHRRLVKRGAEVTHG